MGVAFRLFIVLTTTTDTTTMNKYMERTCKRCGHGWTSRLARKPVVCPRCKSYKWETERPEIGYANPKMAAAAQETKNELACTPSAGAKLTFAGAQIIEDENVDERTPIGIKYESFIEPERTIELDEGA